MKLTFYIHTPGQVHFWSGAILALKKKGHTVSVVARKSEFICPLLISYGIQYVTYGKSSKTAYGKILELPLQFIRSFGTVVKFGPDILLGAGPIEGFTAALLRKPCIMFDDNEPRAFLDRFISLSVATVILTPACFLLNLGNKHVRFAGYKELAYLHPSHFKPNLSIYSELGINSDEKYVILRFNAFDAVHDIGRTGFSLGEKYRLVENLSKYTRVFISSEGSLPDDLELYKLPTPYHKIHQVLYFAQLLVADTGTMAWEAALLGTPTIVCASFTPHFGNFVELEQKYDLLYCFQEANKSIDKAVELIQQPDLKEQWDLKRRKLLDDKIDVTQFIVDFIENYPESFDEHKHHHAKIGK